MKKTLAVLAGAFYLSSWAALAQEPALNDSQIISVMTEANNLDIDNGKLARKKASRQEVKAYAQMMISDHQQANDSGMALSKQLKINPQSNPTSENLKATGKEAMKQMRDLKGAEFDQAYIKNEITLHQMVLDTIDNSLMPSAKNEEVKALLTKTRPVIAAHLEHAQKIQASLGKPGSQMGSQSSR